MAVTPSRVPVTLKSMSPRASSMPWISVRTAYLPLAEPSWVTRPMATPPTEADRVTAAGTAQRSRLAHRERREVVVVHIPLRLIETNRVDRLFISLGAQRRHAQYLSLATGKQARAVRPGQD